MKKSIIIWIAIGLYAACMVGAYFITNNIIEKKDVRLRNQAYDNLAAFFSDQKRFVQVGFSGEKVAYKQIPIPSKPKLIKNPKSYDDSTKNRYYHVDLKDWESKYSTRTGKINILYKLKPRYEHDVKWSGFLFYCIEYKPNSLHGLIEEYKIFPYEVGVKMQEDEWGYYYMPSVQEAVNDAFEFFTNDSKSNYLNDIVQSGISMWDIKEKVDNEYYILWSYEDECERFGKEKVDSMIDGTRWYSYPVWSCFLPCEHIIPHDICYHYGGMYNNYYTVNNYRENIGYWAIKYKWRWNPKASDLYKLRFWCFGVLSFIFISVLTPLLILVIKDKRIQKETLKQKLLRLCHPHNLLKDKPYNKEQIENANQLFQNISSTDETDNDKLRELRKEATNKFGISFIDSQELEKLKKKCNPQKFMKPYKADKVLLANELYDRLNSKDLTIEDFEEIVSLSKQLK